MAAVTPITTALAFHASLASIATAVPQPDMIDAMLEASFVALHEAVEMPAQSLADVLAKLAVLVAQAEGGFVDVDDLEYVVRDLTALEGGAA